MSIQVMNRMWALALASALTCLTTWTAQAQSGASLALQLDGVDDYAEAAHTSAFNGYPLTLTAWVKTSQNTTGAAGIVGKYVASSGNGYQVFLYDGRVRAWYFRDNANFVMTGQLGLDGGFVADNQWHHIAFVVDPTGGKLYVDGALRDSLAWTGTPGACTTTAPLRIGLYNLYLVAQIDEVTLWNTALTSSEISWMRGRTLDGQEPGLVRYYRFNNLGSVLRNSAGPAFVGEDTFGAPQEVESTAPVLALGPDRALESGNRVVVPHAADLNAYPLAVTCWLKTTRNDTTQRGIVGKYVSGSSNGYQMILRDGRVRAWYFRSAANKVQGPDSQGLDGGFIADGNWHHLAFVVTSFGGEIYVDGTLRANQPWTGVPGAPSTTTPLGLGFFGSASLDDTLDEVTLWNRDLRALPFGTNSLSGTSEPGLIGYWRLDETGVIAADSSPFSHTGTLSGSGLADISTAPIDPPFPFTLPAVFVTATNARLRGMVLPQPHGLPFRAWFQWGLTTGYGNTTTAFDGSGTTNVSVTNLVSDLIPGTDYHYRLVVQKDGRQAFGADHLFSTPPWPPFVTTLSVTNRGGSNAALRCSVNPRGLSGTDIWFEWGTTTNLGNQTPTRSFPTPTTISLTETLELLTPGTSYHYRAVARTPGGLTAGATLSFRTLPLPQAVTFPPTNITASSVLMQGVIDAAGVSDTRVWFEWGTTTNLGSTSAVQTLTVTNATVVSQFVTGLTQNTVHYTRAVAQNVAGLAIGSPLSFRTLGPPVANRSSPRNVGATNATFAATVDPNGASTLAWFEWGTTTNYGNATEPVNMGGGTGVLSLTNQLIGLTVHQEYHYRVVASNMFGASYSLDVSLRTALFAEIGSNLPLLINGSSAWGDFDADGDLDFAMAGASATNIAVRTTLFRNDAGAFTAMSDLFPGVAYGTVTWSDFNHDGFLDLYVTGLTNLNISIPISRLYRNTGAGFTLASDLLPAVWRGTTAWGDHDNDGDLDLATTGIGVGGSASLITRLIRNDAGVLSASVGSLPGAGFSSLAWGDYDSDGDADLILAGDQVLPSGAALYRNDHGSLTNIASAIAGSPIATVQWGDYDSDGDLDLWVGTGLTDGGPSRIYRNNGSAQFVLVTNLPANNLWGRAWADYDNDGDLDLLLDGRLYRNDNGTFADIQAGLPRLSLFEAAKWGDYDNDGRLDILIHSGRAGVSGVHRSFVSVINTPPSAPGGLQATLSSNRVDLNWNPSADDHTPPLGLTYNLRVGLTPGGVEVVSPHSDPATGCRRVVEMGNVQLGTNAFLVNIQPNRPYFWSVQAVDTAFAGGSFAPEARFGYATTNLGPVTGASATVQPGQNVLLNFLGTAGVTYTIEASTDLISWRAIGIANANAAGEIVFVDTGGATIEQRFYRTAFP